MSRVIAWIAVVLGIATAAMLLVEGSSTVPIHPAEKFEPLAKVGAETLATTAQAPSLRQHSAYVEPTADPAFRRPLQDRRERLDNAETVAEVIALLRRTGTPPDAAERVWQADQDLVHNVQLAREKLRAHRATSGFGDLADKKNQTSLLQAERALLALRRGDYYFGFVEWPPQLAERIECRQHGNLRIVQQRNDSPLLRELIREVDYAEKVAEFNRMSEASRRRILKLRAKSLREDPPEEQEWLASYFPEWCRIDERTAMIR